ncbi:MAG: Gfo/Idh/MocA family oxidoreductase [Chitinophagaceae bacterium]|nr:Gfo/Idh/MocA family oxidoreductase [Chitinophagaceae bacterium]
MPDKALHIGIVGAGGFAHFAAVAFLNVPGISIVAVSDTNESAANEFGTKFNASVYADYALFLKDSRIELIYIATPPYLHFQQSKLALMAGKHVICEKPAALHAEQAEELAVLAAQLQLLYVVNLMQRYNPLFETVKMICDKKMLGNFLHGFFENYASDENLGPKHWFWDEEKSGGIFIEHAVHFFDLFEGWLDEGKVVNAIALQRPGVGKKITDRVQATVLYQDGIVNFYHGFDQPKILDRQEMRLQFERGEITLYGWIPVKIKLHGLLLHHHLEILQNQLEGAKIEQQDADYPEVQLTRGRFQEVLFDHHVTIHYGNEMEKQDRYRQMLTAMITDQWKWIVNKNHVRVIAERNALQSLKMAETAQRLSKETKN